MPAIRVWVRRLLKPLRARRVEREMEDEMRAHIEMEVDALARSGVAPDEARRQALAAFGGTRRSRRRSAGDRATFYMYAPAVAGGGMDRARYVTLVAGELGQRGAVQPARRAVSVRAPLRRCLRGRRPASCQECRRRVGTYQLGKTAALSGERLEQGEAALRKYIAAAQFDPSATEARAR